MPAAKASSEASPTTPIFFISIFLFSTNGMLWRWRQTLYPSSLGAGDCVPSAAGLRLLGRHCWPDFFRRHDPLPFQHAVKLLGLKIIQRFHCSGRPTYLHALDFCRGSQSKVHAQIIL